MPDVTVTINKRAIGIRVDTANKAALAALTEIVLRDCNRYCKQDTGNLIASSYTLPGLGKVVWNTPYARTQYWKIRGASHDKNPFATWRWCETAKTNHGEDWLEQYRRLVQLYGGDSA